MLLAGAIVGWKNSTSYAEDGARVNKKQMRHGFEEYVKMVGEVKDKYVED
ncbi:MAG TPA: hypothetical protein VGS11_03560 [Candidatus Bathyarchaeia archaeon]|nr:hypothetical protein [Candidatus Bathyarchaeia archaeon]